MSIWSSISTRVLILQKNTFATEVFLLLLFISLYRYKMNKYRYKMNKYLYT